MKKDYKILFLDIDGTLLNSKGEVTEKTKSAILALMEKGVCVVLASGRPPMGMTNYVSELKMNKKGGYLLGFNGGVVQDLHTNTLVYEARMEPNLANEIFEYAEEIGMNAVTYSEVGLLSKNPNDQYVAHETKITKLPIEKFDGDTTKLTNPLYKCLVVGEPTKVIEAETLFANKFGDKLSLSRSSPIFLEAMPSGITKARGIEQLLNILSINISEAVACGDGFNDVQMLQAVGLGIAMNNAPEGVKAMANEVCPSNDDDGVAHVIKTIWGVE